jgi:hypothetical protein
MSSYHERSNYVHNCWTFTSYQTSFDSGVVIKIIRVFLDLEMMSIIIDSSVYILRRERIVSRKLPKCVFWYDLKFWDSGVFFYKCVIRAGV